MAVGHLQTVSGTGSSTAGVAATQTITANAGETLILVAGADSRSGGDEALPANAVTDSAGNTWVRLLSQQSTNSNAAHCCLAIYGCIVTNALVGGTVTLTAHGSSAVKDFTLYRFSGLALTIRGVNSGQVTATTPAGLAVSAPQSGDLVIGATVLEGPTSDTWTPDSDITNGSWSANVTDGTTGGTATNNISVRSQFKITTASGTQTYNGGNNVSRDMQRGVLVLTPTPPPPSAGSPPVYMTRHPQRSSTGTGRIVAGQVDTILISEAFDPRLPPVIYNSGVYNLSDELTGVSFGTLPQVFGALTDMGFLVAATTTFGTFGNATAQSAIAAAATYVRNTYGCSKKPMVLMGGSEGACDAMTYAYVNPSQVACIVGIIPIVDLAEMVEQDVLGLAAAVLAAWGVAALPLPAGADPNTAAHRATLTQVPIQLWYSTDDAVSANATAFRDAVGCDLRSLGPRGHTAAAIAEVWPTHIAEFIRKRVSVPYNSRLI